MLNYIFILITLPFIPIFAYSNLAKENYFFGKEKTIEVRPEKNFAKNSEVLGEEDSRSDSMETIQSCNLFPLDSNNAKFTPVRKKNFYDLNIFAGSSVAIDVDSGTILHYENGRKKTQIASLTKIMTAVLAVENIKDIENEEVTITKEALVVPGTVVGCPRTGYCLSNRMYAGEKVKAMDLLKVMLLNSANDAATALGVYISGSPEKFVELMNKRAKEMGLKDTNFCTPSGLEIDGRESECHSTAYDIARVASYSLRHNLIWDIMKVPEGQFYSTDGKYMHEMKNTDLLLGELPNCLGGKTGFTPLAGKSLLLGSMDDTHQHRIIAVILNDENRWEDMKKMVDWIFNNYEWK
jgi:serine-type D-Ala-D-Ala carboxypeptidase (penicillin-binding protein 5/6)